MKNTEYRLGNWVYSLIIEDYIQITAMTSDVELAVHKINLTEKWLLNFGFVWVDACGCFSKNGFLTLVIRFENDVNAPTLITSLSTS